VAREGVVRLSILLLYVPLMSQVLSDALATWRIAGVLFLCNASLIVLFTLLRRSTNAIDRSWPAKAVTFAAVMRPLVRHPIYAGYFVSHLAFVPTYPTLWNALVWVCSDGAQFGRVRYEEQLLRRDSSHARYIQIVRWRVVPGVF
jgi:protein-S-isoprenylcysteine O-methyltransferase Ste14